MRTAIIKSYIEASNRLSDLGTSHELLIAVIDAVVAAKADCTDFDPFGARGWRGWQMGTRRARETHIGIGDWKKDDTDQVPSIVSLRHGVRFVVCNTDDGTAIETRSPQNSSKKGSATSRAVDANQTSFMDELDKSLSVTRLVKKPISKQGLITYYLCVYSEGDDRRGELSCPVNVENGFFQDFYERIFILGGDSGSLDPIRRKSDDDGGSEYPIPVIRKK